MEIKYLFYEGEKFKEITEVKAYLIASCGGFLARRINKRIIEVQVFKTLQHLKKLHPDYPLLKPIVEDIPKVPQAAIRLMN